MSIAEKTKSKKQRGIAVRVFTRYGVKVVGTVSGSVYEKSLKNSGVLQQPPAVALSYDELQDAENKGAKVFRAVLVDRGQTVSIELERFRRYGIKIQRGNFPAQLAVPLEYFEGIGQTAPRNLITDNPRGFGAGEFVKPQAQQLEFFPRRYDTLGNYSER